MDREYLLGLELNGSELNAGLVDLNGKVVKKLRQPIEPKADKRKIIDAMVFAINKLRKEIVLGVGVGLPGIVDSKRGIVVELPGRPGWRGLSLKKILEERIKLPVTIENAANCFALAEYKVGFGRRMQNLLGVTVGDYVSSGVVLNGKLYKGNSELAGEFGHLSVDPTGPRCSCGGRGCLVSVSSSAAIRRELGNALSKLSTRELTMLAKKDKRVRQAFESAARHLGKALAAAASLLNPDVIVLNGPVTSYEDFAKIAAAEAQRYAQLARKTPIVRSNLPDSGILGAASIVM